MIGIFYRFRWATSKYPFWNISFHFPRHVLCWNPYKITYDSKLLHRFVYFVFLDCEFSPASSWSIIVYLDCHSSLIFYTGILCISLYFMVLIPNVMAITNACYFIFDLHNTFYLWSSGIRSYYDQLIFHPLSIICEIWQYIACISFRLIFSQSSRISCNRPGTCMHYHHL